MCVYCGKMPAMGPYVQRANSIRSINESVKSLRETAKRASTINDPVKKGEAYEGIAKVLSEYANRFSFMKELPTPLTGYVDVQKMREASTAYAAKAAYEFKKAGLNQRAMDNLRQLDMGVVLKALNPYAKLDNLTREVRRS